MSDRHSISPYPIRMPVDLRERLEQCARDGNRSLHAEIIARLQATFAEEPGPAPHSLTYTISKKRLAQPSIAAESVDAQTETMLQALENARQLAIASRARHLTDSVIAEVLAGAVLSERGFSVEITDSMKDRLEALAQTKGTKALDEYAEIMEQVAKIIDERQAHSKASTEGSP